MRNQIHKNMHACEIQQPQQQLQQFTLCYSIKHSVNCTHTNNQHGHQRQQQQQQ